MVNGGSRRVGVALAFYGHYIAVLSDKVMQKTNQRLRRFFEFVAVGVVLLQTQCAIDPDLALRTGVSLGTDAAIFLLENLVRGV